MPGISLGSDSALESSGNLGWRFKKRLGIYILENDLGKFGLGGAGMGTQIDLGQGLS